MNTVVIHGKVRPDLRSPLAKYPGADLWCCTHTQQQYAKQGRTLDVWESWHDYHPIDPTPWYVGIIKRRPETYRWYQTLPGPGEPGFRPLYMFEADKRIRASVPIPWQEILDRWPPAPGEQGQWFTCQVDWMIPHAMLRGYKRIVLDGHGVSQQPEHTIAHRGILYWIAIARASGVEVIVNAPSWYRAPDQPYGLRAGGWTPDATLAPRRSRLDRRRR